MTAADLPAAPGYRPRRTLPLRVEAIRQLRRRRTMVAALILLALPWVLAGAFELGGPPQPGSGAPGLVDLATTGGLNFAAFSFFASVGFLLVVAVALFCGDTVASEAGWGSLRYLLATVSPQNRATATTSRKPTEAKKLNAAKFSPPVVARSTSPGAPLPGCGGPPSSNAPTRIHGSASRMSAATTVRLRRSWRTASTRSGRVRRGW